MDAGSIILVASPVIVIVSILVYFAFFYGVSSAPSSSGESDRYSDKYMDGLMSESSDAYKTGSDKWQDWQQTATQYGKDGSKFDKEHW